MMLLHIRSPHFTDLKRDFNTILNKFDMVIFQCRSFMVWTVQYTIISLSEIERKKYIDEKMF